MAFTKMGASCYTDKVGRVKAMIVSRHKDFNVVTAHHTNQTLSPDQIIKAFGREHLNEVEAIKTQHHGKKN